MRIQYALSPSNRLKILKKLVTNPTGSRSYGKWLNTEALQQDTLSDAARAYLIEIPIGRARRGDVYLFRMGLGHPAKHCAIVSAPDRIIHSYWGRAVCETRLVPWWQRRIAGAFQFPGLALTHAARLCDRA